jgi:hypothetical protein
VRSRAQITQPPWEFERQRRGLIRWYPFDALLQNGTASALSTATLFAPTASLFTGALSATPQNKAREMGERANAFQNPFTGSEFTPNSYWAHYHRASVFMAVHTSTVTPLGGKIYGGLCLRQVGLIWSATPPIPVCAIRYARDSVSDPSLNERWELVTATGGGAAALVTQLTGVDGPHTPASPGGQLTQRLELEYAPGEYVKAFVDGIEGAMHTTNLPDVASNVVSQGLATVGVWIFQGQVNDSARMEFTSLMLESYRR